MIKRILDAIPKNLLGPIAVILGIVYFYYNDPPKTVCDIQFEVFRKETRKYLYGTAKNDIRVTPLFMRDLANCRDNNTVGGCYDWTEGIKRTIHFSRTIPQQCRDRLAEVEPLMSFYSSSLRIYSQISWNSTEIIRSGLFHWLDAEDLTVFCRLRSEYIRLAGAPAYRALEVGLWKELIALKKLPKDEVWRRTVLSHACGSI